MSEPAIPDRSFYVTGGTLKPGEPSYVERRADTELYESILAGEFCYVLTARQMGKSSLMARTAHRLRQAGIASAIVDLTQIGSERGGQASAQWYFGIANVIHRQLEIMVPLRPWWQERADLSSVQRLTDFFRELVLANVSGRIVVFVDEIDSTIGLPFADDFFAALRACFNARATDEAFGRLTFVLLGVATPDQLIRDPTRTPFNIGKRIDLTDFTPDEARVLAPGLHPDSGEAGRRLARVLHWTGGHPYLTQAVCRAVREKGDTGAAEESVDPQVEELFLTSQAQREETNLKHARARLERSGSEGRRLLKLYRRVRQGKPVQDQPTSTFLAQLKLAGVVKATDDGWIAVRNRVYERVFTPEWAKAAMPADRGRQLAAATLAMAFAGILVWYATFQPRPYEKAFRAAIQDDGYNGARDAYAALRANPFSRSRATELMQEFWEQRALGFALAGKRDESLLCYLKSLDLKDSERLRRQAGNLVGPDYERLRFTLRHKEAIDTVAFSPDGRALATGAEDGTAQLWDTRSGRHSKTLQHGEYAVSALAFSPNGKILATGAEDSDDNVVRLWDTDTGESLGLPLGHASAVYSLDFSPDGRFLATGSDDGTARLWDVLTGRPKVPPLRHEAPVLALAFSDDGRFLATSCGGKAGLWDVRTGESIARASKYESYVGSVAFSADGKALATAGGAAQLWDVQSGVPLAAPLQSFERVQAVAFSPDRRFVMTGAYDNIARFWDARTGKLLWPYLRHQKAVFAVAFSPGGGMVATGSNDNAARLWSFGSEIAPRLPTMSGDILSTVALSPDGRVIATAASDNSVHLSDVRTGGRLVTLSGVGNWGQARVSSFAFSPDGRLIATGSSDSVTRLWNTRTGMPLVTLLGHREGVSTVVFSPDGRSVATGSSDRTIRLWNVQTGRLLTPPFQSEGAVASIALSPDGQTLQAGTMDGTLVAWETMTRRHLVSVRGLGGFSVLTYSPDGRVAVMGTTRGMVHVYNREAGDPIVTLNIQGAARTVAFSPSGRFLFVATNHWLNTYLWEDQKAVLLSSQLLQGLWTTGYRFVPGCDSCLQAVLVDDGRSFHLETLHLNGPTDPPIEGDPKKLLEEWQVRLGLKFDEQMRPVPR